MELVLPLNEMTVAEKLQAMELLWDDLSRNPEDIPSPAWHEEVLADRQRQIERGPSQVRAIGRIPPEDPRGNPMRIEILDTARAGFPRRVSVLRRAVGRRRPLLSSTP